MMVQYQMARVLSSKVGRREPRQVADRRVLLVMARSTVRLAVVVSLSAQLPVSDERREKTADGRQARASLAELAVEELVPLVRR